MPHPKYTEALTYIRSYPACTAEQVAEGIDLPISECEALLAELSQDDQLRVDHLHYMENGTFKLVSYYTARKVR